MEKVSRTRAKLIRLAHAELVMPGEPDPTPGMAWDAYLEAAVTLVPDVLTSLVTNFRMKREDYEPSVGIGAERSPGALRIGDWCRRWGFTEEYCFLPAWNMLMAAFEAEKVGRAIPHVFVCTWAGEMYTPWRMPDGGRQYGGVLNYMERSLRSLADWSPHGVPHPFPELEGRLLSYEDVAHGVNNGVKALDADIAGRVGTQVVVQWPLTFWDPAAETRDEARKRILAFVADLLDAELESIVQAYLAHGYERPREKRTPEHFEWLVRYQLLDEKKLDIAATAGIDERHVRKMINKVGEALGIELRKEKTGRPQGSRDRRPRYRAKPGA